jgi:small neutral amino acid transporter SnatA (MarC family)
MNKKVIIIIVVIVVLALIVLAMSYAPSLSELIGRIHSVPQH